MSTPKAYVEHVAIWVKDIHWHIRFFEEVLGMTTARMKRPGSTGRSVACSSSMPPSSKAPKVDWPTWV